MPAAELVSVVPVVIDLLFLRDFSLILRSGVFRRVSKDAGPSVASWFETAQTRLLTMRGTAIK